MQIDIPAHIEKLLFLHDSLIIPGFGGFTATRTPASTDFAGGTVNPPAKALSFSENLTVDDGLLCSDIADAHGLPLEDARRAVEEFVEKMRDLLDQREIVTLPGVGRLYKNYVQKIQFLPDATNFNASSYGLPPLQFSPIARSREVETPPPSPPPAAPQPVGPPLEMPEPTFSPERTAGGSRWGVALSIFLLLAALTSGIWYWQHRKKQQEATLENEQPTVVNTPPKTENKETTPPAVVEEQVPEEKDPEKAAQESLEAREKEAREQVNAVRNGRECILVIATLSDKNNVEKLRSLLKEEGYEAYVERRGQSYMVGARFFYLKSSEIDAKKEALKALTGVSFIAVKKK